MKKAGPFSDPALEDGRVVFFFVKIVTCAVGQVYRLPVTCHDLFSCDYPYSTKIPREGKCGT